MERSLLNNLLCPACGGELTLAGGAIVVDVEYADRTREEVHSGTVECACEQRYPVEDFVLSLASLYPSDLQREAAYWDRYYLWLLEHGSLGFHDLRRGQAPYITSGVAEPFPLSESVDRYDIHYRVADHPLLRKGRTLLDIGVGLGWTSLTFARAGYDVTAFEPSLGPVKAAKAYAMEQGIFIEYLCAALGYISFKPWSFDNVTAFHSLHHVPDLERNLRAMRSWMRPGGALAIDEHVGNSRLAGALAGQVQQWAEEEVFPRYRTISPDELAKLPDEPHSALEDQSVDQVVPVVGRLFDVQYTQPRHVFLDHYPLLYYLATDRDLAGYRHALAIANQVQDLVRQVDPEGGDYVTIVAVNNARDLPEQEEEPPAVIDAPVQAEPAAVELAAPPEPAWTVPEPVSSRVEELERQATEQAEWARGLEREIRRKNAEIARLQKRVQKVESTPLVRLTRLLRRNPPR